jgi:hypothetical protein
MFEGIEFITKAESLTRPLIENRNVAYTSAKKYQFFQCNVDVWKGTLEIPFSTILRSRWNHPSLSNRK